MRKLRFKFSQTGEPAALVRAYASAVSGGPYSLAEEIDPALLTDIGDGYLYWDTVIDSALYVQLESLSAAGVALRSGRTIGPLPASPEACSLHIDLEALGLVPQAGVTFSVELETVPTAAGGHIIDPTPLCGETDASGLLTLEVRQGVAYIVTSSAFKKRRLRVDTAGATFVRLAEVI